MFEIIVLVILAVTNLGTLGAFAWHIYLTSQERAKTTNALIAKNSQEFLNHEMADKIEQVKTEPSIEMPPNYTEVSSLSDKEFDEQILKG